MKPAKKMNTIIVFTPIRLNINILCALTQRFLPLLLILVITSSCFFADDIHYTGSYKIDYRAPKKNDEVDDIFPEEIDGQPARQRMPRIGGVEVHYGKGRVIFGVRLDSKNDAEKFFNTKLMTQVKLFPDHYANLKRKPFYAFAYSERGEQMFAWINGHYVFAVKGDTPKDFDALIKAFKLVSRR